MSQLLAVGIVALGLLIIAVVVFLALREKNAQTPTLALPKSEPESIANVGVTKEKIDVVPEVQQPEPQADVVRDLHLVPEFSNSALMANGKEPLPEWWHEQFQSLTLQLQYLREHAKDVEQQIAILSEMAALAAELETLQRKHIVSSNEKPLLFPLNVNRQPTDGSYGTDKRPVVRKYTIKAM